jgi:hypothetical protein
VTENGTLSLRGSGNLIRIRIKVFGAETKFVIFKGKGILILETCTVSLSETLNTMILFSLVYFEIREIFIRIASEIVN